MISVTIDGLADCLNDLVKNIDSETKLGAKEVAEKTAQLAKQNHWFKNRTGNLENSIKALDPEGKLSDNKLRISVVATVPYGDSIQRKEDFLLLAYQTNESQMIDSMQNSLNSAVSKTESWSVSN